MNSALYVGFVQHLRHVPQRHLFRYRTTYWYLDLEEVPVLAETLFLLGINRRRLFSFNEQDHLDGHGPLRDRLFAFLERNGIDPAAIPHWRLLTHVRQWNYVFNPVSFFYGFTAGEDLVCVLAEVNNTFGERFHYVLPVSHPHTNGGTSIVHAPKHMHVSPFTERDAGSYEFRLRPPGERLQIAIRLRERGKATIDAAVWAWRRPLTDAQLLRLAVRHPWLTAKVTAAIHYEALKLYLKHLRVFHQPSPSRAQQQQAALWAEFSPRSLKTPAAGPIMERKTA
ncbi:MAG: DUF1365 domain-containing protein [Candidatus Binatia bacterium]|nr:DUF1365 domain-containing protein [Candidatus Binatia bacterium]